MTPRTIAKCFLMLVMVTFISNFQYRQGLVRRQTRYQ